MVGKTMIEFAEQGWATERSAKTREVYQQSKRFPAMSLILICAPGIRKTACESAYKEIICRDSFRLE